MRDREKRCSECLQLQKEEMESPYVCEECEEHINKEDFLRRSKKERERMIELEKRRFERYEEDFLSGSKMSEIRT